MRPAYPAAVRCFRSRRRRLALFSTHPGLAGSNRWYKQVTQGDCNTPQPGVWSIEARAKWNGWNKMKGLSADECRALYLEQLSARVPQDWTDWPRLESLKAEIVWLFASCCTSCMMSITNPSHKFISTSQLLFPMHRALHL